MTYFIRTTLEHATDLYVTQHNHQNKSDSIALKQRDIHSRGRGGDGSGITAVCRGRGSSAIYTAGDGAGTAAEYAGDGGCGGEWQRGNSGMRERGSSGIYIAGEGAGNGSEVCGEQGMRRGSEQLTPVVLL